MCKAGDGAPLQKRRGAARACLASCWRAPSSAARLPVRLRVLRQQRVWLEMLAALLQVTRGVMYTREEAEGKRLRHPFDTITGAVAGMAAAHSF